MDVEELALPGLKLLKPRVFGDERGHFLETYNRPRYEAAGIGDDFVQDNLSRSVRGVLRGLHLQFAPGQAKLVRAVVGRIFDVAVDVRPDSPTFKRWDGVWLDDEDMHQLYLPPGFAHGFYVASDEALVEYKVSTVYDADLETGFAWNDPDIGIEWPLDGEPLLSDRDRDAVSFATYLEREEARR